jgi:glycosyltransferase involved in cell wall biosynthesis
MDETPFLSILIPTLDEEEWIGHSVRTARASLAASGVTGEVIVCDAGSADKTVVRAREAGADRLVDCDRPDRARQLNRGARAARGAVLAMVHADNLLRPEWPTEIAEAYADGDVGGWSQVEILPERPTPAGARALGWIAAGINARTRAFKTATGDQAIWVRREVFDRIGGVPDVPIMEGHRLARRLRHAGPTQIGGPFVRISGRRWQRGGILRVMLVMYLIRAGSMAGLPPTLLRQAWDHLA